MADNKLIEDGINDVVAKCDHQNVVIYTQEQIQSVIYTVRGVQVMLDRDLARLYEVETRVLNQAVKRNIERFPEDFMFQLTKNEWDALKSQIVTSNEEVDSLRSQFVTLESDDKRGRHTKYLPSVFTEEGVSHLSAVLKSSTAIQMHIRITRAFIAMRRFIMANAGIMQRLDNMERHQLETDKRIDKVLDCLEEGTLKEKAHIFSAGQIYEAKSFITELIGRAKRRVILIDGYVSAPTIDLLDARAGGVSATIYTGGVGSSLRTLRDQYNVQFPSKPLAIEKWRTEQHDRWLIIDDEMWHCGASIRDAGVRTFGIDPIGLDVNILLGQV